jgi:HlyD family secretion protein
MAKRRSNRLLYIFSGVLALLIVGLMVARSRGWIGKEKGVEVVLATASKETIVEKVSASGKVQPETEIKISPDVSGEIIELRVAEGDSVTEGQLLLRIRPDNYQAMVDQRIAALNTARANLAQAQARLAQTQANNIQTRQTHERNTQLYTQKVISEAEFQASKASFQVSEQELVASRQNVRASEFNVQSAQAAVKEARENLNRTSIYAPVSGIVSKLNVEQGERVVGTLQMAGTEMLRVANLNNMEVRVFVNENDIVRVGLGDSAIVEVDSYSNQGEKFRGVVTAIANSANDALSLEAVTEFEVRIRLLNESYAHLTGSIKGNTPFRPGMTATVDIITEQKPNVLAVPLSAVTTRAERDARRQEGEQDAEEQDGNEARPAEEENQNRSRETIEEVVFLYNAGKVRAVKVKTGISDFDHIEILQGLQAGDQVVSGPFRAVSKQLNDGDAVVVKEEKGPDRQVSLIE